jgi:hypothetical protein
VYFDDSVIERVAAEVVAEFGENAEHELRARHARAEALGLVATASIWEQILQRVEQMRNDDDGEKGQDT